MTEYLLRTAAPALIIVVEKEGPSRLFTTHTGEADLAALRGWIEQSEERRALVAMALLDSAATGGPGRGLAWVLALAAENPGIVGVVERLLERLPAV